MHHIKRESKVFSENEDKMKRYELTIEGMTCHHCIMAVKSELTKIKAIKIKEVNIGSAILEMNDDSPTQAAVHNAIKEAGYQLISTK